MCQIFNYCADEAAAQKKIPSQVAADDQPRMVEEAARSKS
jgi:hypothetical protein